MDKAMRNTSSEPPLRPAVGAASTSAGSGAGAEKEVVVPVLEEVLDVGTRRIETDSGVRIHKRVQERVQLVDEPLVKDEFAVERVPVGRYIDAPTGVRYEGDTTVVPILEEVLIVEKRLLLKEEVRITRHRRQHRNPQRVVLRREQAEVEQFGELAARHEAAQAEARDGGSDGRNSSSFFAKARAWVRGW
jgi:uncharacterized protein (TIGR02271 family)